MLKNIVLSAATSLALAAFSYAHAGTVQLYGGIGGDGFDPGLNCNGSYSTVFGPVGSTTCNGPGASGYGDFSASYGALHLQVQAWANNATTPMEFITMQGFVGMQDWISFGSVRPSSVTLTATEHWIQTSAIQGLGPNAFQSVLAFGDSIHCTPTSYRSEMAGAFTNVHSVSCSIPTEGDVLLSYSMYAAATVSTPAYLSRKPFSGSAAVDASHTGVITGLQFFDDAGSDITPNVLITAQSGQEYPLTLANAVPEPTTVALFSIGLLGVSVSRRRVS